MGNISQHIRDILQSLPEKPGVYQHLNKEGEIIYVGKAKNLKRRVSSYFMKEHDSFKTNVLVKNIADIHYIVVESEQDAFLLENNLIKQYQPKYNILLKDGKSYPSICITKEEYPRVFKTRNRDKKTGEFYGPYSYSNTVDLILELIHKIYPIRTCRYPLTKENIQKSKYKVCLKYHLELCNGVCENKVSREEYKELIEQIRQLIKGNATEIVKELKTEMNEYAEKLEFEKAEIVKRKIEAIEQFQSKTIIIGSHVQDTDVFGYFEKEENVFIAMLQIHTGTIIKGDTIELKNILNEEKQTVLARGITILREKLESNNNELIVPFEPDFIGENLHYTIPQRGDSAKILMLANKNAEQCYLDKLRHSDKLNPDERNLRLLKRLQQTIGLQKTPVFIDSFDNSNIQGTNAVAGCIVFKMGKPSKQDYRKFNIKTVVGADDYASMREVVERRYTNLLEENSQLPDLIVADGGIGQMEAIRSVVEDKLQLDIPIVGLVKNGKHRTANLLYGFPPKTADISPTDELFYLLTRIQDEVHRFAISFHRKKRSKSQTKSELDEIKGIGKETKKQILQHFKSISRLKEAKMEDIAKVIGNNRASIIYNHFHPDLSL